jgi:hypothetical protein
MKSFHWLVPLLCCPPALLFSQPAATESPLDLRLRWLPGLHYVQESETVTESQADGAQVKAGKQLRVLQTTEIRVKGEPAGEKRAQVHFKHLRGEALLNGKSEPFDSDRLDQASPQIRASIGKSVGKTFTLVYDAQDRFLEARHMGGMVEADASILSLPEIAESISVAELYRHSLELGLPKSPVAIGDSWTSQETLTFPNAGTMNLKLHGSLKQKKRLNGHWQAQITFHGQLQHSEKDPGLRVVKIGPGSKLSGHLWFDLDRHTITESVLNTLVNLEVIGSQTIVPVKQTVTTRLTHLEADSLFSEPVADRPKME